MDILKLNEIEVECILGDQPEERVNEQKILVDVALEMNLQGAADSDAIDDTLDYTLLIGDIRDALEEAKCRLLERAADIVAEVCLAYPIVERVTVSVRKFGSVFGLGSAEVKITRPE